MIVALRRFWHVHNHLQECLSYLKPTLDDPERTMPETVRAAALNVAAEIAARFSDLTTAERYGQAGLVLARRHGDATVASRCLGIAVGDGGHAPGRN